MRRDVLFLGMDIIKEMDKINDELESKSGKMPEEARKGYEYAKSLLNTLINESIENEESCVVNIKGLDHQEEFFKSDIFKHLDKNGGFLIEVKG